MTTEGFTFGPLGDFDEEQAFALAALFRVVPGQGTELELALGEVLTSLPNSDARRAAVVIAGEAFDRAALAMVDPLEGPPCPGCGGGMDAATVETKHGLKVSQRCEDCDLVIWPCPRLVDTG